MSFSDALLYIIQGIIIATVIDVVGSIASRKFNFKNTYLAPLSLLNYSLLVDELLLRGQGLARSEFREDVVHPGDREVGVERLLALAVGIQQLTKLADARVFRVSGGGEGKGVKATCLDIHGIVADTEPTAGTQRPAHVWF